MTVLLQSSMLAVLCPDDQRRAQLAHGLDQRHGDETAGLRILDARHHVLGEAEAADREAEQIGRASCRERVFGYV